ncbi:restriction endonuclease [Nocardiopsis sp. TSRI0078]|uniref:HNH endonuclease n=1 Tax=unclassified Nocardiopsis TaxID=2649073 RepID=UPI00093FFE79|nr:HNH endonuclease [Nocardiopsis sp. TSRI0078]OKI16997.1 restriction endonuclease [Nocardiopsis sp. TSRI0078]
MKAFVGVTDQGWAEFLAQRPHLTEINFWRPSSDKDFGRIGLGDLFLFKTRYPHNRIVGGAVFSGFTQVRLSEAWASFGEGNGRSSLNELRDALNVYRRKEGKPPIRTDEDPLIGCIMLRDPVFFPESTTFAPPPDFSKNLVQGKGYDNIEASVLADYFAPIADRVLAEGADAALGEESEDTDTWRHDGPTRGGYRPVRQRLGQEAFKLALMSAYQGRCAVTGIDVPPALEAAHIHPVSEGGLHRLDNGMLLRADVHRLFDQGYLGVSPELTVRVSPRLHEHPSPATKEYTGLEGRSIALPPRKADLPSPDAFAWHYERVFQHT